MKNRKLSAGLLAPFFCVASVVCGVADQHPNVIMVDDMGYGGVSSFDNQNFKTPEINRRCADGMMLTDFHRNESDRCVRPPERR